MTVIDDGLKPGEQVVTDGQLRLVPGTKVQVKGQGQEWQSRRARQSELAAVTERTPMEVRK